jgi:death-on-curing protein
VSELRWVPKHLALRWHARLLERYGGATGVRDEGLLEAALARPRTIFGYEPNTSLAGLAAAYAYGLTQNHPFIDGNKRTAFAVLVSFLAANGFRLDVSEQEATRIMLALSARTITESDLAEWLVTNGVPNESP